MNESLSDGTKLELVRRALDDRLIPGAGPYLLGLAQMSDDELRDERLRLMRARLLGASKSREGGLNRD